MKRMRHMSCMQSIIRVSDNISTFNSAKTVSLSS